jgi:hypothetical protein
VAGAGATKGSVAGAGTTKGPVAGAGATKGSVAGATKGPVARTASGATGALPTAICSSRVACSVVLGAPARPGALAGEIPPTVVCLAGSAPPTTSLSTGGAVPFVLSSPGTGPVISAISLGSVDLPGAVCPIALSCMAPASCPP